MTIQTKILITLIATIAFAIGFVVNSSYMEKRADISPLLLAELEQGDGIARIGDQLDELTLVNFWATWCTPCRDEMPLFETIYRLHQADGFKVIGVAIDYPSRAQPFLDSMDISYPILYAENTGMQLLESSGNPEKLLPYSLLVNKEGEVLDQVLGKIDETQMRAWISQHLNRPS